LESLDREGCRVTQCPILGGGEQTFRAPVVNGDQLDGFVQLGVRVAKTTLAVESFSDLGKRSIEHRVRAATVEVRVIARF
jgi:hypothetical protein